jgi:hypothetical protein
MRAMARLSPTLRALLLVPLLAAGADLARATLACGPRAESCLEAAGQGWLGTAASVLLVLYSIGLAFAVGGLARGATAGRRPPGFLRLWLVGTAGVAAVCGGQALLAGALGDPAALGGGWLELLALCVAAGGLIALALRVAPAAAAFVIALRPAAPRARLAPLIAGGPLARPALRTGAPLSRAAAGRAPPLTPG